MTFFRAESLSINVGGVQALEDVSFEVVPGQVFTIIGPNGAGKTTVFNLVSRIYEPSHGRLVFCDEDITGVAPHEIARRGIARTFQNIELFEQATVLQNLLLGRHVHTGSRFLEELLFLPRVRARELAHREAAEKVIEFLDLQPHRDRLIANLPYGIRKVVELARALCTEPKLLLLDEPSSGLSVEETEDMAFWIQDIKNLLGIYGRWVKLKVYFSTFPLSGKTTILKTVSGVMEPQKGTVTFEGRALRGLDPDKVMRLGLSHVPEGREVFPLLTVRENLKMGAYTRTDAGAVAQDMQMVYDYFPVLAMRAEQRAGLLSGGEQQMLSISRALMARPKMMLLDEPSLGLSPKLVKDIFDIIVRINHEQGVTILLVEQNANMALHIADYGYVLEVGRIVMEDTCARLLEKDDIKEFYLGIKDQSVRGTRRWKRKKMWR